MSAIAALLDAARATLDRVDPTELSGAVAAGAIVVDIRPERNRSEEGSLPGAVVIERNELEWRLDPTSPDRIPEAADAAIRYVLVCNEGYASSLAAVGLRQIGLDRATDLVGGYRAWLATVGAPDEGGSARDVQSD